MKEEEMKEKGRMKHPLLHACMCKLVPPCSSLITDERRRVIHAAYWNKTVNEQNEWLLSFVKPVDKQRSRKRKLKEDKSSYAGDDTAPVAVVTPGRKEPVVLSFMLPLELGKEVPVCQKMFLNSLGFANNQKIVTS